MGKRRILPAVKHTTVARDFNDAKRTLWLDRVKFDNVLLHAADAAPYKKKATRGRELS
jgi:hypothetical protein